MSAINEAATLLLYPGSDTFSGGAYDGSQYAYVIGGNNTGATYLTINKIDTTTAPPTIVSWCTGISTDRITSNATAPAPLLIDSAAGYLYLVGNNGTDTLIVKFSIGSGTNPPTRVGSLTLTGDGIANTGIIDTTNQKLYVATNASPSKVIKCSLGSGTALPTRDGSLTLNSGENNMRASCIDVTNQKGYFGTTTSPAIVVKCSLAGTTTNAPTRDGALTLNSGENSLRTAIIDVTNQKAYFATLTSPAIVVKCSLAGTTTNAPTRDGALTLNSGENSVWVASIDTSTQKGYFTTNTAPAILVKVALDGTTTNAPTRNAALTLNSGENGIIVSLLNTSSGNIYLGLPIATQAQLVTCAVSAGASAPTRTSVVTTPLPELSAATVLYDGTKYAYAITGQTPGKVVKIDTTTTPPTRIGVLVLNSGENTPLPGGAVIDTVNSKLYIASGTSPAIVVKCSAGTGAALPTRDGALTLNANENTPRGMTIDVTNQKVYVPCTPSTTVPGILVKLSCGTGTNAPTRDGAVTMGVYDGAPRGTVIDVTNQKVYSATNTRPARVVKASCGTGTNAPTIDGSVGFLVGDEGYATAMYDASTGYGYVVEGTSPIAVVKWDMSTTPPTRIGGVTGIVGENGSSAPSIIDTVNKKLYVCTSNGIGNIVKFSLGAGSALPSRDSALTLNSGEGIVATAVIDVTNQKGYFGCSSSVGIVVKCSLNGTTTNAPTRDGAVSGSAGENNFTGAAFIDVTNQKGYFATVTSPTRLVKFSLDGTTTNAPTRDGALTLSAGENITVTAASNGIIDTTNQKGYIITNTTPAIVVKCSLSGTTTAAPTRDGALTLNAGENAGASALIDVANQKGYFPCLVTPTILVKCSLDGTTTNAPTRDGALTFNAGEGSTRAVMIDTANQRGYFSTGTISYLVQCALSGGTTSAPTRTAQTTPAQSENLANLGVIIDTTNQKVLVATRQSATTAVAQIVKCSLDGTTTNPPTRDSVLQMGAVLFTDNVTSGTSLISGVGYFATISTTTPINIGGVLPSAGSAAPTATADTATLAETLNVVNVWADPTNYQLFILGTFATVLTSLFIPVTVPLITTVSAKIATSEQFFTDVASIGVFPSKIATSGAFFTPSSGIGVTTAKIASAEAFFTDVASFTVFPGKIATAEVIFTPTATFPPSGGNFPFWYVFDMVSVPGPYPFWYPLYKFPYGNK